MLYHYPTGVFICLRLFLGYGKLKSGQQYEAREFDMGADKMPVL
jgi:hypothetical protein